METNIVITGFASQVRTGFYAQGKRIKVHSVHDALAAISTTIELVGKQSLLYKAPNEYTPTSALY